MKKTVLKMKLSRETLRDLNDDQARQADGAFLTQGCSGTRATCYTCGADPGAFGAQPAAVCA